MTERRRGVLERLPDWDQLTGLVGLACGSPPPGRGHPCDVPVRPQPMVARPPSIERTVPENALPSCPDLGAGVAGSAIPTDLRGRLSAGDNPDWTGGVRPSAIGLSEEAPTSRSRGRRAVWSSRRGSSRTIWSTPCAQPRSAPTIRSVPRTSRAAVWRNAGCTAPPATTAPWSPRPPARCATTALTAPWSSRTRPSSSRAGDRSLPHPRQDRVFTRTHACVTPDPELPCAGWGALGAPQPW